MKTLITGAAKFNEEQLSLLNAAGIETVFHQDERERVENPGRFEAVVCNGLFMHNGIERFTALRFVQLTSAGLDRMPMDYARAHGITVKNAKGVYSIPMAEFAVCGILDLYKKSRFFAENQKQHRWEKHRGLSELFGKTACIVGMGDVGTETARRLKAFGCRIIGVNRSQRTDEAFDAVLPLEGLEEALEKSDIVVIAIALTDETKSIVRPLVPSKMKHGAILVNVARGALIDEAETAAALTDGRLSGAALDVFESEPLDEKSPLWEASERMPDNVILTPHNSFVGDGNGRRLFEVIYKNLTENIKK